MICLGELGPFFVNLTNIIESTYKVNGNKPVVIIGHSMGAALTLILLHDKPKTWKNKYIKAFVSMSGPYGGSAKAVKVFAVGKSQSFLIKLALWIANLNIYFDKYF